MYGGVEPPPSGSFTGQVVAVQQPKTNFRVYENPISNPNPTGYQTALYNHNQLVYIPNPYDVDH